MAVWEYLGVHGVENCLLGTTQVPRMNCIKRGQAREKPEQDLVCALGIGDQLPSKRMGGVALLTHPLSPAG